MHSAKTIQAIHQTLDCSLGVTTRRSVRRLPAPDMGLVRPGMPENIRYEEKPVDIKTEQTSKLVGILFCLPSTKPAKDEILPNLNYFNTRSSDFVDFYCVGYGTKSENYLVNKPDQAVGKINNVEWYFNDNEFDTCRRQIENECKWRFSGETDLLLIAAKKINEDPAFLDYACAISCNLEQMARDQAITSIRAFFESIFRFGENFKGNDPVWRLSDNLGIGAGGSMLRKAVLNLLPKPARELYIEARHIVVSDVSR